MQRNTIHILLADDDEGDRRLFADALKELKIVTVLNTVNDGIELMSYLALGSNIKPQLLFLDLNMPRKSGFECLKEIRGNLKLNDMAVAIFSTSIADKDIEESFVGGANVYINKPNSYDDLIKALYKVVVTTYTYQSPILDKTNFLLKID
jgi:CheY-like chemotaxis protein